MIHHKIILVVNGKQLKARARAEISSGTRFYLIERKYYSV